MGSEHTQATAIRSLVSDLPNGTFVLRVTEGPEAGLTIELDGSAPTRLFIGKSSACDLILTDSEVSRRHCAVELVGARLRVTDLGSTNGTYVDHVAVTDAFLSGNETLRVGSTRMVVEHKSQGRNPPVPYATSFGRLIGASRAMRRLYPLCRKLADARVPLVIEGETGTGKEVLAEALHEEGPLASQPFVVFDCTAVPANLLESELFGHERGAFTGAVGTRKGVFEQAHGGTLFIDEIGDLDLALQPKLLRALERGEIHPVGGDRWKKVDVRVIAATRRDLDQEVQAGRFRDDLFHRLAVTRIELPPLRARLGDVALLANHFWTQSGGIGTPPDALISRWTEWAWPGNVRELRNVVARAVALGEHADIGTMKRTALLPDDAPPEGGEASSDAGPNDFIGEVVSAGLALGEARSRVVDELERRYLERVLREHGGVVTRAAAASGIARRHFQRLRAKGR